MPVVSDIPCMIRLNIAYVATMRISSAIIKCEQHFKRSWSATLVLDKTTVILTKVPEHHVGRYSRLLGYNDRESGARVVDRELRSTGASGSNNADESSLFLVMDLGIHL